MEKNEEILCICSTESTGLVEGIWVTCRICEADIWLSDSTIASIKKSLPHVNLIEHPPTPVCITCGLKRMNEKKEEIKIMPPTNEQLVEIKKAISDLDAKEGRHN